jgi:hypothetical protein
MVDVLNRTTKQFIPSANTPDYPVEQWIHNPDMSAVAGQPARYWEISGDTVGLMDAGERDAVDAAELVAQLDGIADQFDNVKDYARAIALVLLDSYLLTRARVNGILDAIDAGGTLAAIKTSVAAINNLPDVTPAQLKDALREKLEG